MPTVCSYAFAVSGCSDKSPALETGGSTLTGWLDASLSSDDSATETGGSLDVWTDGVWLSFGSDGIGDPTLTGTEDSPGSPYSVTESTRIVTSSMTATAISPIAT